jgi:hypothetical protein
MGLGSRFAEFLRREQRMHAVWPPVVSAVELGDYGAFDDGVFVRLGNIAEFGVAFVSRPSGAIQALRVVSNGVSVTRLQAGQQVPEITAEPDVQAEVKVHFAREYSFLVYATAVEALEISAVEAVASQLAQTSGWKHGLWGWKVVAKRYTASQTILLASREAQTDFSLHGEASLLADFDHNLGLQATVEHQSNKAMALELRAGRGPIGLELFRIGRGGHAVVAKAPDEQAPTATEIVWENRWEQALPTDWL